ncbi:GRB2-associated-binding protein 2 isoform X2 [Chelonus insularis]|uniref:GRB2-associated-binding protein 2 isoform X2 n=1 Tax=Chelonus insularis TaxID=460826 RepID=UPI001588675F|nr:GRB2-associated-binding protein 2 isoform X2 [Chelonus insularis]
MEVIKISREIVYEGWLIKSPPTKLWRAVSIRWRKRWFALRHSGELPGQYFLEYYTDRRYRKLKGHIDLDQCEQVDAGLRFENRKQKYQYMFNIKTPKRIYYLVAESEAEMNKWVDAVCQVCGLKAYTQDEEQPLFQFEPQESPPISPASTISGPYIPISECISGRRLNDSSTHLQITHNNEHYDAPRKLVPSPPQSPTTTDAESVFTDDEWTASIPNVNWDTFPSSSDLKPPHSSIDIDISSWNICKRFGKLKMTDSASTTGGKSSIPPRPPKPSHINSENSGHNYTNLDSTTESSKPTTPTTPAPSTPAKIGDETYDFPRHHRSNSTNTWNANNVAENLPKHFYSNAAPSIMDDGVFRYDFHDDEPSSPYSENSTTATYSNLASPLVKDAQYTPRFLLPPPIVNRELKPGRKMSDSISIGKDELTPGSISSTNDTSPGEHLSVEPPSINRKLKPTLAQISTKKQLHLASPPDKRKNRVFPNSPSPVHGYGIRHHSTSDEDNTTNDDKEEIYYYQDHDTFIPASDRQLVVLQYLDLDLETNDNFHSSSLPTTQVSPNTTVYKTVDFLKTDAFNRTRQRVEEERKRTD